MTYDLIGFTIAYVMLAVFGARIAVRVIDAKHWHDTQQYRTTNRGDKITLATEGWVTK